MEKKTANTILEKPKKVKIGGVEYTVYPPTLAVLIDVSGLISELPKLEIDETAGYQQMLSVIKDYSVLSKILTYFILGKDRHDEKKATKLESSILEDLSPKKAYELLVEILEMNETAFFFGIITFLNEVNLTKPTKTTVSGR